MIDRRAVCKEAHKIRKTMLRLGDDWSWSRCMRYGWNKVKGREALNRPIILKASLGVVIHRVDEIDRPLAADAARNRLVDQDHKEGRRDLSLGRRVFVPIDPLDYRQQPILRGLEVISKISGVSVN